MLSEWFSTGSIHMIDRFFGILRSRLRWLRAVSCERMDSDTGGLRRLDRGFTIIELLIVMGIIGTLASIATPRYLIYQEKVKVTIAITDIDFIKRSFKR